MKEPNRKFNDFLIHSGHKHFRYQFLESVLHQKVDLRSFVMAKCGFYIPISNRRQPWELGRATNRQICEKSALIRLADHKNVECRIIDISECGARLEFDDPPKLPTRFKLQIPEYGFETRSEIRHRTGSSVGVMFVDKRLQDVVS